jgi:hypothetical protein
MAAISEARRLIHLRTNAWPYVNGNLTISVFAGVASSTLVVATFDVIPLGRLLCARLTPS